MALRVLGARGVPDPVAMHPLFRWRMERAASGRGTYSELAAFAAENRAYVDSLLQEVRARGRLAASDLGGRGRGGWWDWSGPKRALEWLFWAGQVTTATRRGFERVYDLPERVLPPAVLAAATPSPADVHRELMLAAARAMGVATARDLRDYYRLEPQDARTRLPELVEAGELVPVRVRGWSQPAFLHPGARRPRRLTGHALLAPFDPLVWHRPRVESLFGFRYRIEIYTPAERRQHGYYVLPFLLGDRLVARVDLKADRRSGVLRVLAAHGEDRVPTGAPIRLAQELGQLACWLGLGSVAVHRKGDLAAELEGAVGKLGNTAQQALEERP